MNKRLLVVAPSSYPPNNPEAYVNAKQIQMLAEAGYIIDLVCGRVMRDYYPIDNDNLLFQHVEGIYVIPLRSRKDLKTLWQHICTFFITGFFYKNIGWAYPAIRCCIKLIRKYRYDYILTKDFPSEVVGLYLTKRYKIRWVATWNDPYIWEKYPEPYGKGCDIPINRNQQKLIGQIGKYSYKNLFPSSRLRGYMLRYMDGMKPESCVIIPHLLLPDAYIKPRVFDGTVRLIYAGSLGAARKPDTLFEGLSLFLEQNPNSDIRLDLMCVQDTTARICLENMTITHNIGHVVSIIPPVPYSESLRILANYDVCLVIEAACAEGIFLPSKVCDYMQCHMPIFAVSPADGVLNDLYREGLVSYFADVVKPADIAKEMTRMYSDFINGRFPKVSVAPQFSLNRILSVFENEILT